MLLTGNLFFFYRFNSLLIREKAFLRFALEEEYLILLSGIVKPIQAKSIKIHPDYIQKIRNQNDIALIRIAKKFDFSNPKKISPICLPSNYKC